jgi:hypothetical protein
MKRSLLITAILFVTFVGCERHNAAELTPVKSAPSPAESPVEKPKGDQEVTKPKDAWDKSIAISSIAMATFALASIYVAVRAERVFNRVVETLSQMQIRADAAGMVRTMATCIEQYQNLENKLQANKLQPGAITSTRYFELLWNLHFAEFHFFKRGFLPREIYSLWVLVRNKEYHANKNQPLLGLTEEEGWTHAKKYLVDKEFTTFVDRWLTNSDLRNPEIMNLLATVNVVSQT